MHYVMPKRRYPCTRLYDVTTQKTNVCTVTTVKTLRLSFQSFRKLSQLLRLGVLTKFGFNYVYVEILTGYMLVNNVDW
jgi:hypothetical protein